MRQLTELEWKNFNVSKREGFTPTVEIEHWEENGTLGIVLFDNQDKDWSFVALTKISGEYDTYDTGMNNATVDEAREKLFLAMKREDKSINKMLEEIKKLGNSPEMQRALQDMANKNTETIMNLDLEKTKPYTFDVIKYYNKLKKAGQTLIHHVYFYLDFWMKNKKTFVLSKKMVEAMRNTDLPEDLAPQDFKYPFNHFIITSPFTLCEDKEIKVHTILITNCSFHEVKDPDGNWIGVPFDPDNPNPDIPENRRKDLLCVSVIGDDSTTHINIPQGETFKHFKDSCCQGKGKILSEQLIKMAFNTILYINDHSRDKKDTEEIRNKFNSHSHGIMHKHSFCPYIYLKTPSSYKSVNEDANGKTLDCRFIVRGHWRNQVCGPFRAERRRIWIAPFWKGPELSKVINKTYVVK